MDIYSHIKSRDIAAYCRYINHQFTPIETAVIINQNQETTMQEKHSGYRWITENTADCEIPKRRKCNYHSSLHEFLRELIRVENITVELTEAEYATTRDLDGIYFDLPVPFKMGDIITPRDSEEVYVLYFIPQWHINHETLYKLESDADSITANAYCMYGNCQLEYNHLSMWDLEYYRGTLTGYDRLLKLLSLQMQKGTVGNGAYIYDMFQVYGILQGNKNADIPHYYTHGEDFFVVDRPNNEFYRS